MSLRTLKSAPSRTASRGLLHWSQNKSVRWYCNLKMTLKMTPFCLIFQRIGWKRARPHLLIKGCKSVKLNVLFWHSPSLSKNLTGSLILFRGSVIWLQARACQCCHLTTLVASRAPVTTPCAATCWQLASSTGRGICRRSPQRVMFPGVADGGLRTTDPWHPKPGRNRRLGSHVCWAKSRHSRMLWARRSSSRRKTALLACLMTGKPRVG